MEQTDYGTPLPPVKKNRAKLILWIAVALLVVISLLIVIPIYLRSVEKNKSLVAQQAINSIKKVFAVHRSENGDLEDLTVEDAVEEADLGKEALDKWDFDVVLKTPDDFRRGEEYNRTHPEEHLFGADPVKYFIATSKKAGGKGQPRQLWYTPDSSKYHGYGIDNFTDPEADFEYLETVEFDASSQSSSGSHLSRYVQKSISTEAQAAISTLRKAYDVYMQTNGTTEGFTVEQALREARLGSSTLRNWNFSTQGNPPRIYLAESTAENRAGAGYKVWYDVSEATFNGFGVNQLTQP